MESDGKEIDALKAKIQATDEEIEVLKKEGLDEDELKVHIDKMHEYNEVKDAAQMVLGRIAVQEGVTTRSLYSRFGLDLND